MVGRECRGDRVGSACGKCSSPPGPPSGHGLARFVLSFLQLALFNNHAAAPQSHLLRLVLRKNKSSRLLP